MAGMTSVEIQESTQEQVATSTNRNECNREGAIASAIFAETAGADEY